jgi:peptidyl-prolyl cis-trans isomerase C
MYLARPDAYRTPERVRVSHILVRTGGGGDAAAKERAEDLRRRAAEGAPFADLAKEASDDPSAKRNGGDLGFIVPAMVDPAFAAAAFAMKQPGELSPVIKTAAGYHVIQFHEREAPAPRKFDDVKAALLEEVRKAAIDTDRTEYQSTLASEPPPRIDERLVDTIAADARRNNTPQADLRPAQRAR